MKKQILLISILIMMFAASAQVFQGGLAGGIVGSQVAGDTYSGFNKAGIYGSIWINLQIGENTSMQTELTYFQKGSRHNPDEKRDDYTFYLMRLGYIEMPFLFQYRVKNKITLEAGPSFSLLIHSYEERDYAEINYGKFNLINPSLMFGIGYNATEKIGIHIRFVNSMLSIRADDAIGSVYRIFDNGQYNDCIVLFASYKI